MRKLMLCAALLCAAPAFADLVAKNKNGDELRLFERVCTNPTILAAIKPEFHARFKAGQASIGGQVIALCYIDTNEGYYYIMPEGADQGFSYPVTIFINQPGT